MLINRQIIFHIKRKTMRRIYLEPLELDELIQALTTSEFRLYAHIMGLALANPVISDFTTQEFAAALQLSVGVIKNARASLQRKGYLLIKKFRDEDGDPMVRVVLGKDQVGLYNLGLKVEILDGKAFKELVIRFDFMNSTLTSEQRSLAVEAANKYYLEHLSK